jgi:hypothetical protein
MLHLRLRRDQREQSWGCRLNCQRVLGTFGGQIAAPRQEPRIRGCGMGRDQSRLNRSRPVVGRCRLAPLAERSTGLAEQEPRAQRSISLHVARREAGDYLPEQRHRGQRLLATKVPGGPPQILRLLHGNAAIAGHAGIQPIQSVSSPLQAGSASSKRCSAEVSAMRA